MRVDKTDISLSAALRSELITATIYSLLLQNAHLHNLSISCFAYNIIYITIKVYEKVEKSAASCESGGVSNCLIADWSLWLERHPARRPSVAR